MGARALHSASLVQAEGPDVAELLERKRQLLTSARPIVSVALPEADAAAEEAAHLVARHAARALEPRKPLLEAAALVVPDDLVVLLRQGAWRMVAGVVCFPSHWSPPSKLGLPVAQIHGPVPLYARELGDKVDRFLDRLTPGHPVWRRNWMVHASPELHAPQFVPPEGAVSPEDHWLRSERQTLTALPRAQAILFTIRTQQVPLGVLRDEPDFAARLALAMRAAPRDLAAYRFSGLDVDGIASWLESLATP
jgi:dimethylamine monooxygenase subunit A